VGIDGTGPATPWTPLQCAKAHTSTGFRCRNPLSACLGAYSALEHAETGVLHRKGVSPNALCSGIARCVADRDRVRELGRHYIEEAVETAG
jgi:hypothetical protein